MPDELASPLTPAGPRRWWIYQRERFPVFQHGLVIIAFSSSAISYSTLVRGDVRAPSWRALLTGMVSSLLFFLQLRIADEFKDNDDDTRYRPYRAVPRGLVTLRELGWLGVGAALVQLGFALWLSSGLLPLLLVAWTYLALMTREFFVHSWLKAHPITYMASHMMILPLVDFYVSSCDWRLAQAAPPAALAWLLVVSYSNGVVLELGRKLRGPEDEETGVETYSALWGPRSAALAWLGAMLCTGVVVVVAAARVDFALAATGVVTVLLAIGAVLVQRYIRHPSHRTAALFESLSGGWTLLMYLTLGLVPLGLQLAHGR